MVAKAAALSLVLVLAACSGGEEAPAKTSDAASQESSAQPGKGAQAQQKAKAAMTVSIEEPTSAKLQVQVEANGDVAAWQEASVGAELSGLRLASVNVNVGDVVRKGQVLAQLAGATTKAENLQSKAALMQAKASLDNAKADADRVRSIADSGALSASQIAQYLTQEKVAQSQFEAAKAAYDAAQVRLGNTQVRSPDDGVISARPATVGAVVGAGQELFRLIRQGRVEWRAEVTPDEIGQIEAGQITKVTGADGREVEGKVRAIAPAADTKTRNITVYVDLPTDSGLKAGTFARGLFQVGETQALTVDSQAVVMRDGTAFVFVVNEENQAQQRKVRTGRHSGVRVEIIDGLKPGERVAVQGAGFLNDGDQVKVVQ
ncbi:efflux RND transporter periplasmic adaptor subunit [Hydrogenophaga sp. 5NK40-0174]